MLFVEVPNASCPEFSICGGNEACRTVRLICIEFPPLAVGYH